MKKWIVFTGIVVAAMISSGTAQASTWVGNSGDFGNSANWDTAPVGGSGTTFTNNNAYYITVGEAQPILNNASINGSTGVLTLDITGETLTYTNFFQVGSASGSDATVYMAGGVLALTNSSNGAQFVVGQAGEGTFYLTNGTIVANRTFVGNAAGPPSTFVVSGTSSVFSNILGTSNFTVGGGSLGGDQLIITNGGTVVVTAAPEYVGGSALKSNNTMTVTGRPSFIGNSASILRVGSLSASGNSLLINNSGLVTNIGRIIISDGVGTNNTISVSGGGQLYMVSSASGIQVTSGAGLSNSLAVGGSGASSLVSDAGSIVVGTGGAYNGLVITNGSLLSDVGAGNASDVVGSGGVSNYVNVFAGGTWNAGHANIDIGSGAATGSVMTINAGGFVSSLASAVIGSASTLTYGSILQMNGGALSANAVTITNSATLRGNGTIAGNTTVYAGGLLAPGSDVGTLVFSNNLTLAGTTLMELDKNNPNGSNDFLDVVGSLTMGGTLTVNNVGADLVSGDTFTLFSAGEVLAGDFSVTNLPSLDPGLTWNTSELNPEGIISVVPEPSTMMLVGSGLALMTMLWRRRGRRSA